MKTRSIISSINRTIAFLSFLILLAACTKQAASEESNKAPENNTAVTLTEAQYKVAGIQTGRIEKRSISKIIKATGYLDVPPQQLISISVPYGGILKNTDLLEGMWVNKGQLIATLEHPDYIQLQQDYLDAAGQLKYAELEYKRQEELNKENVSAAKTFQKTEADYQTQRAHVQGLIQKLSLLNLTPADVEKKISSTISIISPINGYVTQVNANIGKFVNANDVLFQIVDTRHLHAEVTVFEKDVPFIAIGNKVHFILANESKERLAEVHLIGRSISVDRTVRLHCHIEDEDKNMLPGMYLSARIESSTTSVNSLPETAIVQSAGVNYIFIKTGERTFSQVQIETGTTENGFTEVTLKEGLTMQTDVVTSGSYSLLSQLLNGEGKTIL